MDDMIQEFISGLRQPLQDTLFSCEVLDWGSASNLTVHSITSSDGSVGEGFGQQFGGTSVDCLRFQYLLTNLLEGKMRVTVSLHGGLIQHTFPSVSFSDVARTILCAAQNYTQWLTLADERLRRSVSALNPTLLGHEIVCAARDSLYPGFVLTEADTDVTAVLPTLDHPVALEKEWPFAVALPVLVEGASVAVVRNPSSCGHTVSVSWQTASGMSYQTHNVDLHVDLNLVVLCCHHKVQASVLTLQDVIVHLFVRVIKQKGFVA